MNSRCSKFTRGVVWLTASGFCLFLGFAAAGCKKSGSTGAGTVDLKAFDSAAAEVKEDWATALAAAQTNDYATAYLTLTRMQAQQQLTEAQYQALAAESTLVHTRMTDAAQKGDADALKAIQDIRAASRSRGR